MLATPPTLKPANGFSEIRASEPAIDALTREYDDIGDALERAETAEEAVTCFRRWDDLRREFLTWSSLTELRFQQDTRNPEFKADVDRLNALRPKVTGFDVAMKRRFLRSSLRPELEAQLGDFLFARWETDVTAYDPIVESFAVLESKLDDEYVELLAGAQFDFRGERLNLPQLAKYAEHPDRDVRREAAFLRWGFFGEHRARLDDIYDRLVHVRDEMARELGYPNFVDLGYRRMTRVDYGPADVARYRDEIRAEIVPLAQRIVRRQAAEIGVDEIAIWDEKVFDSMGTPRPPENYDDMLAAARGAFGSIHPEIGSFASLMMDGRLIDLQSREGKAGGGFCTSFPVYGLPFIYSNFNGTTHDVNVLLHEMGHAFQSYASREMAVSEYLSPTLEACEVHSMSLEFLSWPQLERFFGADAQRYRISHLKTSLLFLPYGAAVDHFQQFVYENPSASAQDRRAFWTQLEEAYLPWRRNGGIEHLEAGGYWQMQRHIYGMPFYYIDYTLALCCALQFWVRSLDDYAGAIDAYTTLCKRGGELPFQALVRTAGLQSPFETGVLHAVAQRASDVIGV